MNIKSTLIALLVVAIWGSNFVAIKWGIAEIPPLALLTLRFTLTGLLFIPFIKWPGLKQGLAIMSVGLFMGLLHQGLLYVSLETMPAGLMSIILQSQIIMVTLIGWIFLKETIGWRTWTGIAVGLCGIVILVGIPTAGTTPIGYILGFASAFFVALAYVMMKKIHIVHPQTYIALIHLPMVPFIFLSSLMVEGPEWLYELPQLDLKTISGVVLYQAVILSFSHILWQKLMVENPVSQIIPWTLLLPVFGVFFSSLFLNEPVTWTVITGGLLTIAGVGIITLRKIQKGKPPKVEAYD